MSYLTWFPKLGSLVCHMLHNSLLEPFRDLWRSVAELKTRMNHLAIAGCVICFLFHSSCFVLSNVSLNAFDDL